MLGQVRTLLEMIRFSHTLFALPFALLSAALAWREQSYFSWIQLLGILLCMVFARSTAMAFNRVVDRDIDAQNPRTAQRHLPAGMLTPAAVWLFALGCAAGFFASTLLFLLEDPRNPWPIYLSAPVLAFVFAYSYTKRFTVLSHFWLGASLFLAPVGAWIAIRQLENLEVPVILGLSVLFWVAGFDILYACQDVEFDRRAKLHSIPAWLGVPGALRVAVACHALMVVLLLALFWVAGAYLGWIYLTGVVLVGLLLCYEHWLVRPDDLSRVNQAFFQVNGVVSIGLFLIVLLQLSVGK